MKTSPNSLRRRAVSITAVVALLSAALAVSGCGASVDEALVNEAGKHGNALEKVYAMYNRDVLKSASSRDLKDINKALAASDLKQATPGDVRRAQDEIQSRIDEVAKFTAELAKSNRSLKKTPMPDFAGGLDSDFANDEFIKDYKATTKNVESYTTAALGAAKYASSSLEKYLDFLEQWEEYLSSDSTDGLLSAGEASDKALARMKTQINKVDRRGTLDSKIRPLVASMADASSDSAQLNSLIDELKNQYPKSFLAVHIVEKE